MVDPSVPTHFDENAPRWMCLCGTAHVKTAAYVICGIDIVLAIVSVLASAALAKPAAALAISITFGLLIIVVATLATVGLSKRRRGFIYPTLVVKALVQVVLVVFTILAIVHLATGGTPVKEKIEVEKIRGQTEIVDKFAAAVAVKTPKKESVGSNTTTPKNPREKIVGVVEGEETIKADVSETAVEVVDKIHPHSIKGIGGLPSAALLPISLICSMLNMWFFYVVIRALEFVRIQGRAQTMVMKWPGLSANDIGSYQDTKEHGAPTSTLQLL